MATSRTGTSKYLKARDRLKARQDPCWICGQAIDYSLPGGEPGSFEADHVEPYSRGGTDTLGNLRASHRLCNQRDGHRKDAPERNKRSMREW